MGSHLRIAFIILIVGVIYSKTNNFVWSEGKISVYTFIACLFFIFLFWEPLYRAGHDCSNKVLSLVLCFFIFVFYRNTNAFVFSGSHILGLGWYCSIYARSFHLHINIMFATTTQRWRRTFQCFFNNLKF